MGCFWPKYTMFELEKYGGVVFNYTKTDAKFEGKLTCTFKDDMKNLAAEKYTFHFRKQNCGTTSK